MATNRTQLRNALRSVGCLVAICWAVWMPSAIAGAAFFAAPNMTGERTSQTLTASFVAASDDIGRSLRVYLVAVVPTIQGDVAFARTSREWVRLNAYPAPELLATTGSPSAQPLPVVETMDMRTIVGTRLYLGYGLDGIADQQAFDEMLAAGRYRLIHTVGNGTQDILTTTAGGLSPISADGLTGYFRAALGQAGSAYLGKTMGAVVFDGMATAAGAAVTGSPSVAVFSGTTLQETGVDESDLIKSDGVGVFSLDTILGDPYRRDRLRRLGLDANNPALVPVDTLKLPFSKDVSGSGLYLDNERQQLVAIGEGGFSHDIYAAWFMPLYWSQGITEAVLVDTSNPSLLQTRRHLRMTGQLIGSRRIGSTLYLVLRSYPGVSGLDPWWSADKVATNQAIVDRLQATDLLPTLAVDGGAPQPLVDATSCLVQKDNAAASADIIAIVGIDLASSPHRHAARCFTGAAEAFYMSPQSIYLATTRQRYSYIGNFPEYTYETSTDLHKFALEGLDIVYRGSGNVVGHLGFDQNRKSFRMGEHQNLLRVITQTDTRFGGWVGIAATAAAAATKVDAGDTALQSPGRLSILREADGMLGVVGQLPNATRPEPLGKAGEQLYASRFIGERGYLVTYRLTDPLYVLDLSSPVDPKIAGALEISGYSDYLFPLTETLLLGIGKDAITDGGSGDGRFAWYQGVKLALIDVADPANPRESARAVVGRRGTDATVLRNHHGIALQTLGRNVRVGLPVSLHDTAPSYASGKPNDYFDFTRTELDRFEIDLDMQTFTTLAPFASDLSGQRLIENDRALLWNDQVHYYQNGNWTSTAW